MPSTSGSAAAGSPCCPTCSPSPRGSRGGTRPAPRRGARSSRTRAPGADAGAAGPSRPSGATATRVTRTRGTIFMSLHLVWGLYKGLTTDTKGLRSVPSIRTNARIRPWGPVPGHRRAVHGQHETGIAFQSTSVPGPTPGASFPIHTGLVGRAALSLKDRTRRNRRDRRPARRRARHSGTRPASRRPGPRRQGRRSARQITGHDVGGSARAIATAAPACRNGPSAPARSGSPASARPRRRGRRAGSGRARRRQRTSGTRAGSGAGPMTAHRSSTRPAPIVCSRAADT